MAQPCYYLNHDDPFYPRIRQLPYDPGKIGLDDPDGMTFGWAKQELIEQIRQHRDHWAALLREAKKLTEQDVKDYENA